jgi:hypothetical protein
MSTLPIMTRVIEISSGKHCVMSPFTSNKLKQTEEKYPHMLFMYIVQMIGLPRQFVASCLSLFEA